MMPAANAWIAAHNKLLKVMPLHSATDPASPDFVHNAETMRALHSAYRKR